MRFAAPTGYWHLLLPETQPVRMRIKEKIKRVIYFKSINIFTFNSLEMK